LPAILEWLGGCCWIGESVSEIVLAKDECDGVAMMARVLVGSWVVCQHTLRIGGGLRV
jgi:hypothetical protein